MFPKALAISGDISFFFFDIFFKKKTQLTATVEPFLPTPPAKITENIYRNDHKPQTNVSRHKVDHNSKLPNI